MRNWIKNFQEMSKKEKKNYQQKKYQLIHPNLNSIIFFYQIKFKSAFKQIITNLWSIFVHPSKTTNYNETF